MRESGDGKPFGIYIHIPFCVRKCGYCDFLSFPAGEELKARYTDALKKEIRASAEDIGEDREAGSVFFGGGTPSILEARQLLDILETLRAAFRIAEDAEITVECNPGTLTAKKLSIYRDAGVNRLSLGLQSADDGELRLLGRIHTCDDFLESYRLSRRAGFANINVDLMSALPGQSVGDWLHTLSAVTALDPEHISAYSLIIEEGTPFFEKYGSGAPLEDELPDEDTDRRMYALTKSFLAEKGYERYEISNYAKPGYECRHNCGYWERTDYRGFGLGASSLMDGVRFKNTSDLDTYLKGDFPLYEEIILSGKDILEERMFLGLRMMKGVEPDAELEAVYANKFQRLEEQGLIERRDGRICLTDFGIDVSNYVLAEFLL